MGVGVLRLGRLTIAKQADPRCVVCRTWTSQRNRSASDRSQEPQRQRGPEVDPRSGLLPRVVGNSAVAVEELASSVDLPTDAAQVVLLTLKDLVKLGAKVCENAHLL